LCFRQLTKMSDPKYSKAGSEALLSGDFGESFVAYLLAKKGITVARAGTVGFDLLARDHKGNILAKNKISGISVKTRISKRAKRYVPGVPLRSAQTLVAAKRWNAEPYLAVVIGSINNRLDVFIIPFKKALTLSGKIAKHDYLAAAQLYKNKSVIKLF